MQIFSDTLVILPCRKRRCVVGEKLGRGSRRAQAGILSGRISAARALEWMVGLLGRGRRT